MLLPTRHLVEDLVEIFLLVTCSVAMRLVHSNAILFLSREIDHFRMLSRLPLGFTVIFATGYNTVLRVSCVVSIFNCCQSAKL